LDYVIQNDLTSAIDQSLESLPENCKKIFRLSRIDGLKNKEIASTLSISVRTVETQIYRALKIIRANLKEHLVTSIFFFMLF